jgi:hypothetical protein
MEPAIGVGATAVLQGAPQSCYATRGRSPAALQTEPDWLASRHDRPPAGAGTRKPVVVSRTGAISTGYGVVDGENCRLVEPGDAVAFGSSRASLRQTPPRRAGARRPSRDWVRYRVLSRQYPARRSA